MKLQLKGTLAIVTMIVMLTHCILSMAETDTLESLLEKEVNNWYQAYNQEEKSEKYFRLFKLAYQDLAKADKAGKIGTKRYLAEIHLLLGEDKKIDDYHKNTENKNKLFRYFGNDDDLTGLHNFQTDCKKKGILNESSTIQGSWTVNGIAKKLGVSNFTVLVIFCAINDYLEPNNGYTFSGIEDW